MGIVSAFEQNTHLYANLLKSLGPHGLPLLLMTLVQGCCLTKHWILG